MPLLFAAITRARPARIGTGCDGASWPGSDALRLRQALELLGAARRKGSKAWEKLLP